MTPVMRERLETNIVTYNDPYPSTPSTRTDMVPTRVTIQLDVHGPNSADNAALITTLWFSDVTCQAMAASGIAPLFAETPRQLAFLNAERQYEDRWSLDLTLQANIAITTAQQFAGVVTPNIIEVDTTYRP